MKAGVAYAAVGSLLTSLSLGGCWPKGGIPQTRTTGSITVTVGRGAVQAERCVSPGASGVVQVRFVPQALTGAAGLDTQDGRSCSLPELAQEVARDIESGAPTYGCQCTVSLFNLKTGSWSVVASGSAGAGSCPVALPAQDVTVKVWQSVCLR